MTDPTAILCIDIDGTLINADEKVHPEDARIMMAFPPSIQPIFTTGRNLHSTKGVLHANGLFTDKPLPLPGIFMNGGAAYLTNEVLCIQHIFPFQTRDFLVHLASQNPQTTFSFFAIDTVFLVNDTQYGRHIARRHYLNPHFSKITEVPQDIIKVMILEDDRRVLENIASEMESLEAEMGYSMRYAYEVNPRGITKSDTLTALLEFMKISNLPVYVAGDAENDLTLFQYSQKSFAPSTAHPSILEQADHIIARDDNGLLLPIFDYIYEN